MPGTVGGLASASLNVATSTAASITMYAGAPREALHGGGGAPRGLSCFLLYADTTLTIDGFMLTFSKVRSTAWDTVVGKRCNRSGKDSGESAEQQGYRRSD